MVGDINAPSFFVVMIIENIDVQNGFKARHNDHLGQKTMQSGH